MAVVHCPHMNSCTRSTQKFEPFAYIDTEALPWYHWSTFAWAFSQFDLAQSTTPANCSQEFSPLCISWHVLLVWEEWRAQGTSGRAQTPTLGLNTPMVQVKSVAAHLQWLKWIQGKRQWICNQGAFLQFKALGLTLKCFLCSRSVNSDTRLVVATLAKVESLGKRSITGVPSILTPNTAVTQHHTPY